ncbi:MAG TPA: hypothetical protein VN814_23255 [Caulobacteraceae bacterium]|nr:hypothetical protein [Caulobacteraceae bacterium]
MSAYARWLFGVAAAANLLVAAAMSLGQGLFVSILGLDPITGTNIVLVDLAAVLIGAFGYGYGRIALDPGRFRSLIAIGAWGKLAAVATVLVGALTVPHLWRLFALVGGDVAFAVLFLDYLRRTSPAGVQS